MTKKICIAAILALLLVPAFQAQAQQTAKVQGTVTVQGNTPAKGYVVMVGRYWSYTDENGHYLINGVPYGDYTLEVKQKGKVVKKETIKVQAAVVTENVSV